MKKFHLIAIALAATTGTAYVAPANATLVFTGTACSLNDITPHASACLGYYDKNELTASAPGAASADEIAALNALGLGGTITVLEKLENVNTVNFLKALNGTTYIGIHYGGGANSPFQNSGGLTAFYKFDAGSNLDIVTTAYSNLSGVSLYSTGTTAVPEPATWAMMVIGFGIIGFGMRRRSAVKTNIAFG